jgi:hypothetical protein
VLFFFFFLIAIPVFCHTAFTVPFGRPFFQFIFLVPLPIGDATGLRGTFPGHPRPFHLTFTDIHNNIYTPMGTLPDGTRTRADLAVVAERVLILPSTTLPSAADRHTYTHIHGRAEVPSFEKILPLRWNSNPLASGPRPRSTFSDSHAATEPKKKLSISFWYNNTRQQILLLLQKGETVFFCQFGGKMCTGLDTTLSTVRENSKFK